MKTKEQYLNHEISHEEYYSQFVDQNVKQLVLRAFTKKQLCDSIRQDPYFNNLNASWVTSWVALSRWDSLAGKLSVSEKLKEANDFLTLAVGVCILKQAAREIVEEVVGDLPIRYQPIRAKKVVDKIT